MSTAEAIVKVGEMVTITVVVLGGLWIVTKWWQ